MANVTFYKVRGSRKTETDINWLEIKRGKQIREKELQVCHNFRVMQKKENNHTIQSFFYLYFQVLFFSALVNATYRPNFVKMVDQQEGLNHSHAFRADLTVELMLIERLLWLDFLRGLAMNHSMRQIRNRFRHQTKDDL